MYSRRHRTGWRRAACCDPRRPIEGIWRSCVCVCRRSELPIRLAVAGYAIEVPARGDECSPLMPLHYCIGVRSRGAKLRQTFRDRRDRAVHGVIKLSMWLPSWRRERFRFPSQPRLGYVTLPATGKCADNRRHRSQRFQIRHLSGPMPVLSSTKEAHDYPTGGEGGILFDTAVVGNRYITQCSKGQPDHQAGGLGHCGVRE